MKFSVIFIQLLVIFFGCFQSKQPSSPKPRKIVLWIYDKENSRRSNVGNVDTLEMSHSKISDSLYYTKIKDKRGKGYFNVDLTVDLKQKKAQYIEDDFSSTGDDDISLPARRDTFKIKYIDNKFFELYKSNKKYFIYRFLIQNNKDDYDSSILFWSKDYGIILFKPLTHDQLLKIEFLDNNDNININNICFLIFGDSDFYQLRDWKDIKQ